ncbi:hypothetical protein [Haloferula helveola]
MTALPPTPEVCERLKDRLQEAEAHVKDALAKAPDGDPLAGPTQELLAIHTEIRDMLLDAFDEPADEPPTEEAPEVVSAAIEIEREAHTLKADFKDVLKALFMWKDDPVERVKGGS